MPLKHTVVLSIGLITMMIATILCTLQGESTFASSPTLARQNTFASSPTLARQEGKDGLGNLTDMNQTIESNMHIDLEDKGGNDNSIDIQDFSYFSDGRFLNATLSFSDDTKVQDMLNRTKLNYGMLIDADNNNETGRGGIDYKVEIEWNKNSGKNDDGTEYEAETWYTIFEERFSEGLATREWHPYPDRNFTGVFDKGNVQLSAELGKMGYPDQYKVVFFAEMEIKGESTWHIDFTNWVRIPLPEISISISPNPVIVRAGDSQPVELQVRTGTNFFPESNVTLSVLNDAKEGVCINLNSSDIQFPTIGCIMGEDKGSNYTDLRIGSNSLARISSEVRAEVYVEPNSYSTYVSATTTFPSEDFNVGILLPNNTQSNTTILTGSKNVTSPLTFITADVQPYLRDDEKFLNSFAPWSPFLTIILTVIGLVIAFFTGRRSAKGSK